MKEKLKTLSLAELKELGKAQGLKGISSMRKQQLIDWLAERWEAEVKKQQEEKEAKAEKEAPKAEPAVTERAAGSAGTVRSGNTGQGGRVERRREERRPQQQPRRQSRDLRRRTRLTLWPISRRSCRARRTGILSLPASWKSCPTALAFSVPKTISPATMMSMFRLPRSGGSTSGPGTS